MQITVYSDLAKKVGKKLDRLAVKAKTYGIPFSYTMGKDHPVQVRVCNPIPGAKYDTYTVSGVSITIECEELIKSNGWTVCAKLEHHTDGNIVTAFGCEAKTEWYTMAPHCDHCHTNRRRDVTYIVEHTNGATRQVGRSCLKDYTGIDPATAALWAEIQELDCSKSVCTQAAWESMHLTTLYSTTEVLALACDAIQEYGYRKVSERMSTRQLVLDDLSDRKCPSVSGIKEAEEISDWLRGMRPGKAHELESNCIPLVMSGFAEAKHIGRLVYMPVAYRKYVEGKANNVSEYVGKIGERITFKADSIKLLATTEGHYGTTWIYRICDASQNVFIWYASKECEAGSGVTIKGTVKGQNERDGVKQTVLTRCKVVA